jgi:hypothetical protein
MKANNPSNQPIDIDIINKILSNPEIINRSNDLNDALHPHIKKIQLIKIGDNWFAFLQRIYPVLRSYIILSLIFYATLSTIKAGTLNKIIDFVTHKQGDWSLLLIGCATYVSIIFINKKWK